MAEVSAFGGEPKTRSLTTQTYERLREHILRAYFAPGEVILEAELAVKYGVSKTPVREALRLLDTEGWIVTLPRRGYLVKPVTLTDIRELFELRLAVEPLLAGQAARRVHLDAARHLQELAAKIAHSDDSLEAPGRRFHVEISRIAANDRAARLLMQLLDDVRRLHYATPELVTHPADEEEAHRRIADAIAAGNAEMASAYMKSHIETSAELLTEAAALRVR